MHIDEMAFLLFQMKAIAAKIRKLDFAALSRELRRPNANDAKRGLAPEDVALLAELAEHLAKTDNIVDRIAKKSQQLRKNVSRSSMN